MHCAAFGPKVFDTSSRSLGFLMELKLLMAVQRSNPEADDPSGKSYHNFLFVVWSVGIR